MSVADTNDPIRLGFLEAMEVESRGYVGGLLITNQAGRPLEFQCTTPVKPNRTQEILYGRTLKSWLLGELIGGTLLQRVSIKPDLVITSDPNVLELRNHTSIPVACASDGAGPAESPEVAREVRIGGSRLRFHQAHPADGDTLQRHRNRIPDSASLAEPLERVREALTETVKTVFSR